MPYEQKPNSGSLWATPKPKVSKAGKPYDYYTGNVLVQCPHCHQISDYWLNSFYNADRKVYNFSLAPRMTIAGHGYTAQESSPF